MAKSKIKHYVQVRQYKGGDDIVDVWFIEQQGIVHQSIMHGEMPAEIWKRLENYLQEKGVDIVSEKRPYKGLKISPQLKEL